MTANRERLPEHGTAAREQLVERMAGRARFIRLETVRLAQVAGAGHYTGIFSAAEPRSATIRTRKITPITSSMPPGSKPPRGSYLDSKEAEP
jgi:hypothetical protein